MKNLKCKLFGHKPDDITDSGYPICKRCGSHSYYDEWHNEGVILRPIWFIQWQITRIKWRVRFWISHRFYNDDLPF